MFIFIHRKGKIVWKVKYFEKKDTVEEGIDF